MANALRAAASSPSPDPTLANHAGMIEGLIAAWSQFDIKVMLPFYLTMLGTVVAAAGDPVAARAHFESSLELAKSTGMHFYDAETLRLAAALGATPSEVLAGLRDAITTARAQGAHLFELRAALDLYGFDPAAYAADLDAATRRFPGDARYPELDRARTVVATPGA